MDKYAVAAAAQRCIGRTVRALFPGGRTILPLVIFWEPTLRCNQRCRVCFFYGDNGEADPSGELSTTDALSVLDRIVEAYRWRPYKPVIVFSGGEPLLYPGIGELTRRIREHGLKFAMLSNFMTESKEIIRSILRDGPEEICVSLDGPAEVHDSARRTPGAFERTLSSLRFAMENKLGSTRLRINAVLTPENCDCLQELHSMAMALNIPLRIQLLNFVPAEVREAHEGEIRSHLGVSPPIRSHQARFSPTEGEAMREAVQALCAAAGEDGNPVTLLPPINDENVEDYYSDFENYAFGTSCIAPWTTLRINNRGDCYPCYEQIWGNLLRDDLREIVNGPEARQFRRMLRRAPLLPGCRRCPKLHQ